MPCICLLREIENGVFLRLSAVRFANSPTMSRSGAACAV